MKHGLADGVASMRLLAGMELGSGTVKVAVASLCKPLYGIDEVDEKNMGKRIGGRVFVFLIIASSCTTLYGRQHCLEYKYPCTVGRVCV